MQGKKTVVVYKSKTGFAKKYAVWIAEELSADLFEAAQVTPDMLAAYDAIIYGGGLYISGINGVKLITKNPNKLAGKRSVVFASGATPGRKEEIDEIRNSNFTPEQQERIRFFYLRGGFDYRRLKLFDKVLMTLLKWKMSMKRQAKLTPDEKGLLAAYNRPVDFTKKKNIEPLISYIRSGD